MAAPGTGSQTVSWEDRYNFAVPGAASVMPPAEMPAFQPVERPVEMLASVPPPVPSSIVTDSTPIPLDSEHRSHTSPPESKGFTRRPVPGESTSDLPQVVGHHGSRGGVDTASSRSGQAVSGIPRLDYRLYGPPLFELSADLVTLSSRSAPNLLTNAAALASFLRAQATVPPKPQIHVKGTRPTKVDFDIKLNLMGLLVADNPQMATNYVRCVSEGELAYRGGQKQTIAPHVGDGGLEEWCKRFVADAAEVKSFELARTVTNLDTLYLDGQIRSLLISTGYKGNVTVSFPTTHARVVVQSADKIHKLVTSFKTLLKPKSKYEVVQAVWPFASARMGEENRQYTTQSEESWWREWRDPIKFAIATNRHGWVTNEDKLEALMEGKGKGVQPVDWDME